MTASIIDTIFVIYMNLFEFFSIACSIAGMILGGIFGYQGWNVPGAILGVPIGLAGGYLFSITILFLMALVLKIVFGGPLFAPKHTPEDLDDDKTGT